MKILIVGGTWTVEPKDSIVNKKSSLVEAACGAAEVYCPEFYNISQCRLTLHNGGCYYDLENILNTAKDYDIVFWWPHIPDNTLPKIRDVKEVAPHVMLVTSKRNDNDKYSFMELTQRALHVKANIFFEFKYEENVYLNGDYRNAYHISVFDPLGCCWYEGYDMIGATIMALHRLDFLRNITRQATIKSTIAKNDVMDAFLKRNNDLIDHSDRRVDVPNESEFIEIVKQHAETFYEIFNPGKDVKRFLGNASLRAKLNIDSTRCMRGMPSFKKDDIIFVSQRNIDKQFISLDNFVPCYMEEGKLYYCGDNKPSVDTPIQVRLYEALPHINYIIHSHCYIEGAPFTSKPVPCGAIEEVEEVMQVVKHLDTEFEEFVKTVAQKNRKVTNDKPFYYQINLLGHGSLLMARDANIMRNVKYIGRQLPEIMF